MGTLFGRTLCFTGVQGTLYYQKCVMSNPLQGGPVGWCRTERELKFVSVVSKTTNRTRCKEDKRKRKVQDKR